MPMPGCFFGILTVNDQHRGWTPLCNGKDLQAWHQLNGKATYEVKDGTIPGTTIAGEPN